MTPDSLPEPIAGMSIEHRCILTGLSDLVGLTNAGVFDPIAIAEALERLVDTLEAHVHKEETLLFPAMREALGDNASAMELLEVEHSLLSGLRNQLYSLSACFEDGSLTVDDIDRLAGLVQLAADKLQPHIFKEDHVLYPLAGRILSKDTLSLMTAQSETCGNG